MVDYEKIGKRIQEERKHILKISQERMAEELEMYQADISNLEKAKKGSGISDLTKLDLIADYLSIPLENLIFGQEGKNMPIYYGNTMQLKESNKRIKKSHGAKLLKLLGIEEETDIASLGKITKYICGPYDIYCPKKIMSGYDRESKQQYTIFVQVYYYVFFGDDVAAVMVTDKTLLMQHICQTSLHELQECIPHIVLDVTDSLRTINPYWALYQFSEDDEEAHYSKLMFKRMDELRAVAQDDAVLYIENLYVREDYRQKGVARMLLDLLKAEYGDSITWLNMEPTAGAELNNEYGHMPFYTASELGQLNINAAIAEKLGFTVDPDTWHIQAEKLDENGEITTELLEMRKCAYRIPKKIREIMKDDGNLVALGRAKQQLAQQNEEEQCEIDMRNLRKDGYIIYEMIHTVVKGPNIGKKLFYYGEVCEITGSRHYIVSVRSPVDCGTKHDGILAEYNCLEEALGSEYETEIRLLDSYFINVCNKQDLSDMDMFNEDYNYSCASDDKGHCAIMLKVTPTKGKWSGKTLFGTAIYECEKDYVQFLISEKSYEDLFNDQISDEEYAESVIETFESKNGELQNPDQTDFYMMYVEMQKLIVQLIMDTCNKTHHSNSIYKK